VSVNLPADVRIVPFDADQHAQPVLDVWHAGFGQAWPMTARSLWRGLAAPFPSQRGQHFVAVDAGDQVVGFVATQFTYRDGGHARGNLGALVVAPSHQRRGIGAALVDHAVEHLRRLGAARVQPGGLYPRLWPGVPENLPGALAFFEALGWAFVETIEVDLVGDLTAYETPASLHERMAAERVTLTPARTISDVRDALAFQQREFPPWYETYEHVARLNDWQDILLARDADAKLVGTLLMSSAHSHPTRSETAWEALFGQDMGSLGEVGVAASARGRGIGLALVAWGSAILRRRGVRHCLIGWTTLADFYAKLGYRVWQRYRISRRPLA
jgi:beta-N-acetylhexosaminidase